MDSRHNLSRRPLVSVIGSNTVTTEVEALAVTLGHQLALCGLSVLCGGRGGVMAAVCRGVWEARADADADALASQVLTVGMLPNDHCDDANAWLDIAIPTGVGLARNAIVATGGQAVVAVAGSSGTLSEMAFAWQMNRPLCALVASGGWAATLSGTALDSRRDDVVYAAASPADAARWARQQLLPTGQSKPGA